MASTSGVTTGKTSFAVRATGTTKAMKDTAMPLPYVDARQRAHDNATNGNAVFAVRAARYARQCLCRAVPCYRCHAHGYVAVAGSVAVRCGIAVRPGGFAVRPLFAVRRGYVEARSPQRALLRNPDICGRG
jgi:hypothetical protein